MRKVTAVTLFALALGIAATPARADNDDWGWHMWGWRNGVGSGSAPKWMRGGDITGRMRPIDLNNDGVIGDDEAAAQVEAVFAVMDADDDGEITEEEYMAVRMGSGARHNGARQKAMQDRKQERFVAMDPDRNGKVTQAEFIAAGKTRFLEADSDKDGKVTPWEFRAMRWH